MKKPRNRRWRFWADMKIQGPLVARIAVYWAVCQSVTIMSMIAMSFLLQGSANAGSSSIWTLIIPALTVSILFLPFALYDAVVFSNRFVGPLLRFRVHLRDLAETGSAKEINFRPGDYYHDLTAHFNELCRKNDNPELEDSSDTQSSPCPPMLQMKSPNGIENYV